MKISKKIPLFHANLCILWFWIVKISLFYTNLSVLRFWVGKMTKNSPLLQKLLHHKILSWENLCVLIFWVEKNLSRLLYSMTTNKYYGGDISVSFYWFYNFSNQIIWCSVWICIAHFLFHTFSFCWAVAWTTKDVTTKRKNKSISSK